MTFIDLILNIAALLLWLNCRSARFDPLVKTSATSLVGTLRRAEPRRLRGWPYAAALALLLGLRGLIYWQVASAADWIPKLDLGLVILAFRNDWLTSLLLYSLLSFARILILAYVWALSLVILNTGAAEPDPILRMLRLHLGRISRWPWPLQALMPLLLITCFWAALHPLLLQLGLASRVSSDGHLIEQGLLIALGAYVSLKLLYSALLLLYLIVSYVFLGSSPIWDFICVTGNRLLAPLKALPLRVGKLDFAPVLSVVLILLLLHVLPNYVLRRLSQAHLSPWPQ